MQVRQLYDVLICHPDTLQNGMRLPIETVWTAAAKYEQKTLMESTTHDEYLAKLQKKLRRLQQRTAETPQMIPPPNTNEAHTQATQYVPQSPAWSDAAPTPRQSAPQSPKSDFDSYTPRQDLGNKDEEKYWHQHFAVRKRWLRLLVAHCKQLRETLDKSNRQQYSKLLKIVQFLVSDKNRGGKVRTTSALQKIHSYLKEKFSDTDTRQQTQPHSHKEPQQPQPEPQSQSQPQSQLQPQSPYETFFFEPSSSPHVEHKHMQQLPAPRKMETDGGWLDTLPAKENTVMNTGSMDVPSTPIEALEETAKLSTNPVADSGNVPSTVMI